MNILIESLRITNRLNSLITNTTLLISMKLDSNSSTFQVKNYIHNKDFNRNLHFVFKVFLIKNFFYNSKFQFTKKISTYLCPLNGDMDF